MIKDILFKLAKNVPLDDGESAYLGHGLVSVFEMGADVPAAFNRPKKLGRPKDFSRNIDVAYEFCRMTSSGTKPTVAYLEVAEQFHLDERQIKNIVKEYESFVREHFPFANEPLWK